MENGMSQYTISCELHDFLEIACLYGYRVKLTLKDQQIIEGNAIDDDMDSSLPPDGVIIHPN